MFLYSFTYEHLRVLMSSLFVAVVGSIIVWDINCAVVLSRRRHIIVDWRSQASSLHRHGATASGVDISIELMGSLLCCCIAAQQRHASQALLKLLQRHASQALYIVQQRHASQELFKLLQRHASQALFKVFSQS